MMKRNLTLSCFIMALLSGCAVVTAPIKVLDTATDVVETAVDIVD